LTNGIFKDFCEKAKSECTFLENGEYDEDSTKYVFIIDEINRGEISKIFGELFFSIDPGYRGVSGGVKTQYANLHADSNEKFYVPENVYIIGTMNDIDRSVESFDFAMRRRFTWHEITAIQSAERMKLLENTKTRMTNLNNAIEQIEGLNASYHIGAAYFLKKDMDKVIEPNYDDLWNNRLGSLIFEYLRGGQNPKTTHKKLKKIYDQITSLSNEQIKEIFNENLGQ